MRYEHATLLWYTLSYGEEDPKLSTCLYVRHTLDVWYKERSGSVVEWLTRDRGAVGSSLNGVTALWSLSKTHLS